MPCFRTMRTQNANKSTRLTRTSIMAVAGPPTRRLQFQKQMPASELGYKSYVQAATGEVDGRTRFSLSLLFQ